LRRPQSIGTACGGAQHTLLTNIVMLCSLLNVLPPVDGKLYSERVLHHSQGQAEPYVMVKIKLSRTPQSRSS
jgi:hypothetical protein